MYIYSHFARSKIAMQKDACRNLDIRKMYVEDTCNFLLRWSLQWFHWNNWIQKQPSVTYTPAEKIYFFLRINMQLQIIISLYHLLIRKSIVWRKWSHSLENFGLRIKLQEHWIKMNTCFCTTKPWLQWTMSTYNVCHRICVDLIKQTVNKMTHLPLHEILH